MKGYNFEVLESFQSFVHNMAENIGIDVSEAWATPASTWNAYTYAEESTVVKDTYTLDLYERNIQIGNGCSAINLSRHIIPSLSIIIEY